MSGEHVRGSGSLERQPAGQHRVRHHAQRVDVTSSVNGSTIGGLLRRHEVRRADDGAEASQSLSSPPSFCDAEVREERAPRLVVKKHVIGFDIAVNYADAMSVIERLSNFADDAARFILRKFPLAAKPVGE